MLVSVCINQSIIHKDDLRPDPTVSLHDKGVVGGTKSHLSNECLVVQQHNGKKEKKLKKKHALKGSSSKLNFTFNKTRSDNFFNLSE